MKKFNKSSITNACKMVDTYERKIDGAYTDINHYNHKISTLKMDTILALRVHFNNMYVLMSNYFTYDLCTTPSAKFSYVPNMSAMMIPLYDVASKIARGKWLIDKFHDKLIVVKEGLVTEAVGWPLNPGVPVNIFFNLDELKKHLDSLMVVAGKAQ